ncbi:hypothetical protein Tco_1515731 [Tanacetum coccineum]
MTTIADKAILSGADNRPPMLEKDMYDSWKRIMELYMMNRQHGRMILESVKNDPLIWPSIEENGVTRPKKYSELSATNHKFAKELWARIQLLMQGTSLTKQEREYVKLVQDLHTTNIDQLHAYLGQHEFHANEVHLMHERNSDLLALYGSPYQSQQYLTHQSSTPLSITLPSSDYQSSVHHNVYSPSSSIPQLEYAPTVNQQPRFSQPDSGLTIPVFQKGDDPIDAINHMMSFLTAVVISRYPTTNNQLRNLSNPMQQATINNGRVTCTKPKRKRDDSWFKDKVLLVQAQASGQILHEEDLAFFADPGIPEDELNTAKVDLMANLSHYGSDALAEAAVQNSNSSTQQDALILSVIEQLKTQVVNCTRINLDNKSVNDTLTAELERYKEQVKVLKEGQNVDLRSNDTVSDSSA